jgi:alkylated DNA repair dioxygenase AlkB
MRQATLFAAPAEPIVLVAERGDVVYHPEYLDADAADALFADVVGDTQFVADTRMMYGRCVAVPRETAGRGDGMRQPWTPGLLAVRAQLEATLGTAFDYVFVNRYRDGRDSVAWHGDHERDPRLVIASLSLGATRRFDLRPRPGLGMRQRTVTVEVAHGDLIVMAGETQQCWEHRVRKDPSVHETRINLTFRQRRPPC